MRASGSGAAGRSPPRTLHEIDVAVEDPRWEAVADGLDALVRRAVGAALARERAPCELAVVLADDAAVRALNRTWRGQDRPTNVLSFPAPAPRRGAGPRHLGDVVLAYDTMLRESGGQDKPLAHHLAHLLVHGTLHLLGHDHETGDDDARAMEGLETAILRGLGIPDPYDDPPGGSAA